MSDFSPVHGSAAPYQPIRAYQSVTPSGQDNAADPNGSSSLNRGDDRIDFSAAALRAQAPPSANDLRQELIARVRAEIAADQYETPERLEVAVARLAEDLER